MATNQPRKLEDFCPLTRAEQQVLDELATGEVTRLGDGEVPPEDADPERQLRARFVRWPALGGDDAPRLHRARNGNPDHHCRRAAPPSHPPPQGGRRLTAPPSLLAVAGLSGIIKSD